MTDLAIGVRLKADSSGLVGQVREARAEVENFGQATAAAGVKAATLAQGTGVAEQAVRELALAESAAGTAAQAMATDQRQAAAATGSLFTATSRHTRATNDNSEAARRNAFAIRSAGQQVGDFGLQVATGQDVARAFGQQIGQLGFAMSDMGGRAGKVGAFLTGTLGIGLTIVAAIVAPLIQDFFQLGEAEDAAKVGAYGLSDAQSVLGQVFDLTSGKIKSQNELLILNARLTAINLRADALAKEASSRDALSRAGDPSTTSKFLGVGAVLAGQPVAGAALLAGNLQVRTLARQAREASGIKDEKLRGARLDEILKISDDVDFQGSGVDKTQFQQALVNGAASRANNAIADLIDKSLDDGKLATEFRKTSSGKKPAAGPKAKSTAPVEEFGRDTKDRIASVLAQFDDTPPAVRSVNAAVRQLDDLMEDLERRKPPGFKDLIADAGRAKVAVQDGVNKPYNDFLDAQSEQIDIQRQIALGRDDEAAALRIIFQLERQMGTLGPEREKAIRASVAALRDEERQVDRLRQRQQLYLNAIQDVRSIITETIYEGPNSLAALPGKLIDSFKQLYAEDLVDRLFGDLFQQLEDQVTGAGKVDAAATRISGALDRTAGGLDDLARSAAGAAAALSGEDAPIEVTAPRREKLTPEGIFGDTFEKILRKIGVGEDTADEIGKKAGKAFKGVFEGQAASGVLGLLGVKQSNTGAAIGGAIGSFIPGIGSVIGGLVGGTLGGLLAPKARPGGVTVGAVDGEATRTGTSGSDAKLIGAAGSLGDAVAAGINRIAEQLGGEVGSFNVSIGKYKNDLRVNENGKALGGVKGSGAFGFGDDEGAAVAKAISLAIAQGGVQGLSSAVAKALQSSSNIDKALKEALKVAEIETLIDGVGGQLRREFKEFDALAAERVSLARKYGLDLLQIEKINAEQRADLLDKTMKSRIGSLQDLLANFDYGDLFEGSASERRTSILAEIGEAEADAKAGIDGAADRLSQLYRTLIETSREAYGAGPEYAADRATAKAGAAAIIDIESRRIADAAAATKAQIDAIASNSALTDENSAAIAANTARMEELTAAIARLTVGGYDGADYTLTAR